MALPGAARYPNPRRCPAALQLRAGGKVEPVITYVARMHTIRNSRRDSTARLGIAALTGLVLVVTAVMPPFAAFAEETRALSEIIVTAQRREQPAIEHAGNIAGLQADTLAGVRHQHVHELFTRVSGVWLSRGSGQESLTAIRSPVLTGPGSCGGFLFLEDGIPTRPAGFCNVNQLFEVHTEQAQSIEVIRGPGNALYGANALHGTVNTLMPMPGERRRPQLAAEAGANDYYRLRAQIPFDSSAAHLVSFVLTDDGGFRDDTGYRQAKLHMKATSAFYGGELTTALSLSDLDQDTAGFITGRDAYRDPERNRSNPNPEAFREAASARLYAIWSRKLPAFDLDVRPYVRRTDMRFLQHFLPGQPLEENGHVSAGVITAFTFTGDRYQTVAGFDLEWSDVFLRQTQQGPTPGSDFLRETRPEGKHYDYDVSGLNAAVYAQVSRQLSDRLTIAAGLRAEHVAYDYDNRMLSGNTRDDGTACGFGGCLYTRPEDRSDSFSVLVPKLSAAWRADGDTTIYTTLSQGFRPPQMTELYRLQSGQTVAELDTENLDSLEIGVRRMKADWTADLSAFVMRKRDSVFRDAEGFNVSGARSRHEGIEAAIDVELYPGWLLSLDASYARHRYDFDRIAARGETFVAGRDIDTAPRWLGSAEIVYDDPSGAHWALQWTAIGRYYLDAENRFEYPGHGIFNLRVGIPLARGVGLFVRLNNLGDRAIADRADYAFGEYRYFPGRGREVFAELRFDAGR